MVSLDIKIIPRLYRGKKNERSYNKVGELKASPKRLWKEKNLGYNSKGLATALLKDRRFFR